MRYEVYQYTSLTNKELRDGKSQEDCLDRHYPKSNYKIALTVIHYAKAGAFFSILLIYNSPTLTDSISLVIISLLFFLVGGVSSTSVKSMGELLLRSFDKQADKESLIAFMRKYVYWYTVKSNKHPALKRPLLDSTRGFCLRQLDSYDDSENILVNLPDVQGSLFESPKDFDIYCDRYKGINYIFHGKNISCEIDHGKL